MVPMFENIVSFELPLDYNSVLWEKKIRGPNMYRIKYLDFTLEFYRSSKGWVGKVIDHPWSPGPSGITASGIKHWRDDTWEIYDNNIIGFIMDFLEDIKTRFYDDPYEGFDLGSDIE